MSVKKPAAAAKPLPATKDKPTAEAAPASKKASRAEAAPAKAVAATPAKSPGRAADKTSAAPAPAKGKRGGKADAPVLTKVQELPPDEDFAELEADVAAHELFGCVGLASSSGRGQFGLGDLHDQPFENFSDEIPWVPLHLPS